METGSSYCNGHLSNGEGGLNFGAKTPELNTAGAPEERAARKKGVPRRQKNSRKPSAKAPARSVYPREKCRIPPPPYNLNSPRGLQKLKISKFVRLLSDSLTGASFEDQMHGRSSTLTTAATVALMPTFSSYMCFTSCSDKAHSSQSNSLHYAHG